MDNRRETRNEQLMREHDDALTMTHLCNEDSVGS